MTAFPTVRFRTQVDLQRDLLPLATVAVDALQRTDGRFSDRRYQMEVTRHQRIITNYLNENYRVLIEEIDKPVAFMMYGDSGDHWWVEDLNATKRKPHPLGQLLIHGFCLQEEANDICLRARPSDKVTSFYQRCGFYPDPQGGDALSMIMPGENMEIWKRTDLGQLPKFPIRAPIYAVR